MIVAQEDDKHLTDLNLSGEHNRLRVGDGPQILTPNYMTKQFNPKNYLKVIHRADCFGKSDVLAWTNNFYWTNDTLMD